MKMYLTLLFTFAKIGLFTIGGGYAMVPLIRREFVERRKWISEEDFVDLLAVSQSVPGILAINMSIFVGYKLRKFVGSLFAVIGTAAPSFLIILFIAMFFTNFRNNEKVLAAFKGIRPAVVALIAAPCLQMAKSSKVTKKTIAIPIIATLLIWLMHVSPIYVIIAGGLGGLLYGTVFRKEAHK